MKGKVPIRKQTVNLLKALLKPLGEGTEEPKPVEEVNPDAERIRWGQKYVTSDTVHFRPKGRGEENHFLLLYPI